MKKLITASILASTVLFAAGPINLGVVQSNNVAGITTATNGSDIKQGSIEIYGDSSVSNPIGPLLPNVASVNAMAGLLVADNNSTIEQGTVQISDSKVSMIKVEANAMAAGAIAKNNSEVSQGKWKIVDVHGTSSVKNIGQTNAMLALASATNNSKITQGNIEVGSVDDVKITVTGIPVIGGNKMIAGVVADGGSNIDQGSIKICGNTHLALCGN
ncbi:hypothetical protein MNB_SV-14-988 [hydrothermal vent metagenome]|uniref:Uncharacterized protein n=1 Tax=hydrothermal vent metagenome TaxID=652676 RepID=A0A1W1CVC5_9ZZZZ